MSKEYISFNVNNHVRIRLTAKGLKMWQQYGGYLQPDRDGFSELQCWEAMAAFGHGFVHGSDVPFETEIGIPAEELYVTEAV